MRGPSLYVTVLLAAGLQTVWAQTVPALEWVKQFGDSGQVSAVASASDRQGNFYFVGNTTALSFPVVSAAQPQPDGTLNSPDSPAAVGSAITIFANGVGLVKLDGAYAITAQPISVYIDGFYANGIAASLRKADGLPGPTYAISVYIPDPSKLASQNPNLVNFQMPPQVPVFIVAGPVNPSNPAYSTNTSQKGLALSVKPN